MLLVQSIDVSHKTIVENIHIKSESHLQELSNACISHEMRNPMNAICGLIPLMMTILDEIKSLNPCAEILENVTTLYGYLSNQQDCS